MRGSRKAQGSGRVVAAVLAAAVVTGLAGVASAVSLTGATAPGTSAPVRVHAVDEVQPQPIALTFESPVVRPAAAPVAKAPAARPAAPAARRAVATAPARTTPVSTDCSGAGWQQRRGAKALASLRYGQPAGVTIAFLPGRGSLRGLTYFDRAHVDVFVGTCAEESDRLLRHVVAHELGHAHDALTMSEQDRAAYKAARGIPASTPWFGCSYCSDFATPAGDFAETYAQWQRGATTSRTQIARPATAAELASLAARFFR